MDKPLWKWIPLFIISVFAVFNKSQAESLITDFDESEKSKARTIYRLLFIIVGTLFAIVSLLGMLGKL